MMTFLFGYSADPVHKIQRLFEVRKTEFPSEMMVIHNGPRGQHFVKFLKLGSL